MKTAMAVIVAGALAASAQVYGGDGHHKHVAATSDHPEAHPSGKQESLEGRLIGLTCFVKHGAAGKSHKKCAKECAEKGLPLGILTDAGKVYQISGRGHGSLKEANSKLVKYAEQRIVAVGETFSKNGMNMIVVSKVKGI